MAALPKVQKHRLFYISWNIPHADSVAKQQASLALSMTSPMAVPQDSVT